MSPLGIFIGRLEAFLPSLNLFNSVLFVCFCALAVHKVYNKYEFEPRNFVASFLLLGAIPFLPFTFVSKHFSSQVFSLLVTYGLFYSILCLSIVFYRVSSLHPLAKYPGPVMLKASKFGAVLYAFGGKQHILFKRLHDQYGPFVRVGPNEVSIVDVDAVQSVFAIDGTRKGPQYVAHYKPNTPPNIVTIRNVNDHRERRKLWNHGFTTSALKDYQPILSSRVLQLTEHLGKSAAKDQTKSQVVDLAEWMSSFTYDFMGDLVFGGGFEFMRDGDDKGFKRILEQTMRATGYLEHIPWIIGLIDYLDLIPEDSKRFFEFGSNCINKRKEKGSIRKDLFYFITNEDKLEDVEVPPDQVTNDIYAAIVAGADTTATVLGGIFYYLLTHREAYERLKAEVDSAFPLGEGDPLDSVKLAAIPYLNAVINETLRLQPAVPTALQRSPLKGSGGKLVAGRFIPENTAIYIPPYALHRDLRYFSSSPDSFIPERWLDVSPNSPNSPNFPINSSTTSEKSERYRTNTTAFIPFSSGPASCAGKNLALMEMRMVVATVMQKFDVRLGGKLHSEGGGGGGRDYDPCQWEEDLQDHFVMKVGRLPVILTARE
ncbi:hypothetical protein ACEPAG_5655 [Sanghuangporus baumii]